MEVRRGFFWLWKLTALFVSATADERENSVQNCSSKMDFTQLSEQLERALRCEGALWSNWTAFDTAEILNYVSTLTHRLHSEQLKDCEGAQPHQCPPAEAPEHGGLLCVTISQRRFCKPLCNHGYDFGFLRLSRVFDECSQWTGYKWSNQYTGGNRLAVCNVARLAVAGVKSAYFPKEQSCLQSKANSTLSLALFDQFITELHTAEHQGAPENLCLVCGLH